MAEVARRHCYSPEKNVLPESVENFLLIVGLVMGSTYNISKKTKQSVTVVQEVNKK